jgi:hypothetical protein
MLPKRQGQKTADSLLTRCTFEWLSRLAVYLTSSSYRILDSRVWSEPVGPPPLPQVATPPAPQPSRFGSSRAVPRDLSPAPSTGSKMSSFGFGRGKDEKKKEKEERKAMEAAAAAAGNGHSNGQSGDGKKKGLFKVKW